MIHALSGDEVEGDSRISDHQRKSHLDESMIGHPARWFEKTGK